MFVIVRQMAEYYGCQNSGKSIVDCRRSEQIEERCERGELRIKNALVCSLRASDAKQDEIEETMLHRVDAGQLSDVESTGFEPHVGA